MRIFPVNKKSPYMAVDPGLNGTGWVVFKNTKDPMFLANGVINFRNDEEWDVRVLSFVHVLATLAEDWNVSKVYCEYPAYFDSAAGQMVAKKGDLLKLTFLVGCIAGFLHPTPVVLVPVHVWKGQLPKEIVKQRIVKILGSKKCKSLKSHDYDATGIGLFVQGLL
jgi:Holliday junction resolvasome RuvABC endonuclease subunit